MEWYRDQKMSLLKLVFVFLLVLPETHSMSLLLPDEGQPLTATRLPLRLTYRGEMVPLGGEIVSIYDGETYDHFFYNIDQNGLLYQLNVRDFDKWLALDIQTLGDVPGHELANTTSNLGINNIFELLVRRASIPFSCNQQTYVYCYDTLMSILRIGSTLNYMRAEFVTNIGKRKKRSSHDDINAIILESDSASGCSATMTFSARRIRLCTFSTPRKCACQDGSVVTTSCGGIPGADRWFWQVPVYHTATDSFSLFFKSRSDDLYIRHEPGNVVCGTECLLLSLDTLGSDCTFFHYRPRAVVPSARTLALETMMETFHFLKLQDCPGTGVGVATDAATGYELLDESTKLKMIFSRDYSTIDIPCL